MPRYCGGRESSDIPGLPYRGVEKLDVGPSEALLHRLPRDELATRFRVPQHCPPQGPWLRRGMVCYLMNGTELRQATLSLYINGFTIRPSAAPDDEMLPDVVRVLSPFSVVETCHVSMPAEVGGVWAGLKITTLGPACAEVFVDFFAFEGACAPEQRDGWARDLASAVARVTASLFPPHTVAVWPLPGVESTLTRILSGYLLRSETSEYVRLVYCELRAYSGGSAKLAFYADEWCERSMGGVDITAYTMLTPRRESPTSCMFHLGVEMFCARTHEERDLWYRALANIKTKLSAQAPDPTGRELMMFRAAVSERILDIDAIAGSTPLVPTASTPGTSMLSPPRHRRECSEDSFLASTPLLVSPKRRRSDGDNGHSESPVPLHLTLTPLRGAPVFRTPRHTPNKQEATDFSLCMTPGVPDERDPEDSEHLCRPAKTVMLLAGHDRRLQQASHHEFLQREVAIETWTAEMGG